MMVINTSFRSRSRLNAGLRLTKKMTCTIYLSLLHIGFFSEMEITVHRRVMKKIK